MKTILALVMIAFSAGAYGQLVKCVGKDGKVEYARDCPAGTTEQKTGIKSSPASSTSSAPPAQKSIAERDAEFKKRMIEQQEAQQKEAKKAAESKERSQDCEIAQAYLKGIESGQRLSRTDPKTGERVFLEDAERDAEVARARARITDNCK